MKLIFLTVFSFILFSSCKKTEGPAGQDGKAGANGANGLNGVNYGGTGTLIGNVKTCGEDGQVILTDQTTKVFIPGTTYSTTIDVNGSYTLANVPTGVYSVFANCVNYSSANAVDVSVGINKAFVKQMGLTKIPTWGITGLSASTSSANITFNAPAPIINGQSQAAEFYFSKLSTINPLQKNTFLFSKASGVASFIGGAGITISINYFHSNGFNTGDVIYAKVYPAPSFYAAATYQPFSIELFNYTDTLSGSYVNTGLNLAGVMSTSLICP